MGDGTRIHGDGLGEGEGSTSTAGTLATSSVGDIDVSGTDDEGVVRALVICTRDIDVTYGTRC